MQKDLEKALVTLRAGGTILYPTDTIWGIGCDATNPEAVQKIYNIKQRNDSKSLIVLLHSFQQLSNYIKKNPDNTLDIINNINKPTTIIYPEAKNLATNLIASDGSIGIRITNHEFCSNLLKEFNKPIVSTSANISNQKYPSNFKEINKEILQKVDYIVKWEQNKQTNISPSSIIKINEKGEIIVLR